MGLESSAEYETGELTGHATALWCPHVTDVPAPPPQLAAGTRPIERPIERPIAAGTRPGKSPTDLYLETVSVRKQFPTRQAAWVVGVIAVAAALGLAVGNRQAPAMHAAAATKKHPAPIVKRMSTVTSEPIATISTITVTPIEVPPEPPVASEPIATPTEEPATEPAEVERPTPKARQRVTKTDSKRDHKKVVADADDDDESPRKERSRRAIIDVSHCVGTPLGCITSVTPKSKKSKKRS